MMLLSLSKPCYFLCMKTHSCIFSEDELLRLNPEEELVDLVNNSSIASELGELDTPSLIDLQIFWWYVAHHGHIPQTNKLCRLEYSSSGVTHLRSLSSSLFRALTCGDTYFIEVHICRGIPVPSHMIKIKPLHIYTIFKNILQKSHFSATYSLQERPENICAFS